MQRQLEQIIVAATLAFLLGCHAGLSKLLPLIPASAAAAFADFYRSGSTAFRQSGSWQCQSNAAGNQSGACLSSGADK